MEGIPWAERDLRRARPGGVSWRLGEGGSLVGDVEVGNDWNDWVGGVDRWGEGLLMPMIVGTRTGMKSGTKVRLPWKLIIVIE